jgi:rhodanese-related sulfurtransferase
MMRHAMRTSALALALLTTTAAHAADVGILQATLAEASQKTAEVNTAELRRILADGGAMLLDTRSRAEFDAGHIPGARNLDAPAAEQVGVVERLVGGNKGAALVLYCNGPFCQASRRLAEQLVAAGFTGVRRYQLGIPVWRALGGPVEIEIAGVVRVFGVDRTAVFVDARAASDFTRGSVAGAVNAPIADVTSGKLKPPLPEDDFNRRIILFGQDAAQARQLAETLSKRPWHNVSYFAGSFDTLRAALEGR